MAMSQNKTNKGHKRNNRFDVIIKKASAHIEDKYMVILIFQWGPIIKGLTINVNVRFKIA